MTLVSSRPSVASCLAAVSGSGAGGIGRPSEVGVWVIVVAAGSGARFGGLKQFRTLGSHRVIDWAVQSSAREAEGVVVVVAADRVESVAADARSGLLTGKRYSGRAWRDPEPESEQPRADVPAAEVPAADGPTAKVLVTAGGATRSDSVRRGLALVPSDAEVILVHDGARPLADSGVFRRVIAAVRDGADAVVPVVGVHDTMRWRSGGTADRSELVAVQTPQGFRADVLRAAHAGGADSTDDASLAESTGFEVVLVEGDHRNLKITSPYDLAVLETLSRAATEPSLSRPQRPARSQRPRSSRPETLETPENPETPEAPEMLEATGVLEAPEMLEKLETTGVPVVTEARAAADAPVAADFSLRVGQGFDAHRYSGDPKRPLVLGGQRFDGERGLEGHSDADVVAHACMEALLAAAGLDDIGQMFPDTDPGLCGADSIELLRRTVAAVRSAGWNPVNVSCSVVLDSPKIAARKVEMQRCLSEAAEAPVTVAGRRTEGLGALGRGEGVAAWAVALVSHAPKSRVSGARHLESRHLESRRSRSRVAESQDSGSRSPQRSLRDPVFGSIPSGPISGEGHC